MVLHYPEIHSKSQGQYVSLYKMSILNVSTTAEDANLDDQDRKKIVSGVTDETRVFWIR